MRPVKLTMQAFGTYAGKEEVDFARLGNGLFLMTGPTGSGKTTVFDAIKYALFGEMSGSTRKPKSVRSGYASPDTITYVELFFEHNGKIYRAYRAPKGYRVVSKRKTSSDDGLKEATEDMSLECVTDGVSLAGKSSEMSKVTEELLGLSAQQFGNIVMIAQGEFAKLLNADTKERRDIFRRVFSTQAYLNAQESLKAACSDLRTQLKAQSSYLENELRGISPSEGSQYLGIWQNLQAQGDFEYHVAEFSDLLQKLIEEDSARLEKGEAELRSIGRKLAAVNSDLGAAQADEENRKMLAGAQAWVDANAQLVAAASDEVAKQEALKPQRDELQKKIALHEAELPAYGKHEAASAKLDKLVKEADRNASALQQAKDSCEALAARQAQLVQQLEALGNLEAQDAQFERELSELNARDKQLAVVKKRSDDLGRRQADLAVAQDAANQAIRAAKAAADDLSAARESFNRQAAGLLARDLVDDAPCPVCGSCEHPRPAQLSPTAITKEQVESLERKLESLRSVEGDAVAKSSQAQAHVEAAAEALAAAVSDAFGDNAPTDVAAQLDLAAEVLAASRADYAKRKAAYDGKVAQHAAASKELGQLQGKLEAAKAKEGECDGLARQLEAELASCRTEVSQLAANLRHPNLKAAQAEVDAEKIELKQAEQVAAQARSKASRLANELAAKSAVIESCEKKIDGSKTYDIEALKARKAQLDQKNVAWSKGIGDLQGRIKDYKSRLAKIVRVRSETAKLEERYKVLNDLSSVANAELGRDRAAAGRVTFEAYVQGVYFRQVLAAANERLRILSDMRYELLHKQEAGDARSLAGLDMEVLDRNTGKTRDVSSLSGGETFLASLSLALGFADVIQAQASGVRIDAMFIDEGFGSLDEDTCATALKVLDKLAQDDRLVGVISHVDQLKRHICKQVVIEKDADGSHVRLEV